jgi:hypothetical protein
MLRRITRLVALTLWFILVSVAATRAEVRACTYQAEGLIWRPYSMYCIDASSCEPILEQCENGACSGPCGFVGWWQDCRWYFTCGIISRCSGTGLCA